MQNLRVSASAWNRFIAALDKWVSWALYEGLLNAPPFRKIEKTMLTPRGLAMVSVNAECESGDEAGPIRFLAHEDYLLWRDVGLRGQLPDGRTDPSWRGRHDERNACFADLLVVTGMRLTEASSLLVNEVPPLVERRKVGEWFLPATITKRSKARSVFVSRRGVRGPTSIWWVQPVAVRRATPPSCSLVRRGSSRHRPAMIGTETRQTHAA